MSPPEAAGNEGDTGSNSVLGSAMGSFLTGGGIITGSGFTTGGGT